MNAINLSPAQQRQMDKLAERVDRVTQADDRYFERFPNRQHRVRLSSEAELAQQEILQGAPVWVVPGFRMFTAVKNIAPGIRMRLYVQGSENAETDLDESSAKSIFAMAVTPRSMEIERQLRKAAEVRA